MSTSRSRPVSDRGGVQWAQARPQGFSRICGAALIWLYQRQLLVEQDFGFHDLTISVSAARPLIVRSAPPTPPEKKVPYLFPAYALVTDCVTPPRGSSLQGARLQVFNS